MSSYTIDDIQPQTPIVDIKQNKDGTWTIEVTRWRIEDGETVVISRHTFGEYPTSRKAHNAAKRLWSAMCDAALYGMRDRTATNQKGE